MLDIVQELIDYEKNGLHDVISKLNNEKKIFLLITLDHILQIEDLVKKDFFSEISFIEVKCDVNDSYNEHIDYINRMNSLFNNNVSTLSTNIKYDTYDIYVNIYDKNKNIIDPYSNDEKFFPIFQQINNLFQQLSGSVEFINKNTSIGENTSLLIKTDEHIGENLKNFLLSEELKASLSYSLIKKQLQDSPKAKSLPKNKL